MGRAVRVKSQLKSHHMFANAFPRYCQLVDNARLYSTNTMGSAKVSRALLLSPPLLPCGSSDITTDHS